MHRSASFAMLSSFALAFSLAVAASSGGAESTIAVDGAWTATPAPVDASSTTSTTSIVQVPDDAAAFGAVADAEVVTYARDVDIGALDRSAPLAIGLGSIASAYEVRVDGVVIGKNGDVDAHVEGETAPRAFAFEPRSSSNVTHVALRVWKSTAFARAAPLVGRFWGEPWIVGPRDVVALEVARAAANKWIHGGDRELLLAIALFVVALYHVFLWVMRRDLWAWLFYGITVALLSTWALVVATAGTSTWPALTLMQVWKVGPCLGALAGIPFLQFVFRFLDDRTPPRLFRWAQLVIALTSPLCLLPGDAGMMVVGSPIRIALFVIPMASSLFVVAWRAWKGSVDARILVVSFGAMALPEAWQIAAQLKLVPASSVRLEIIGFAALVLGMATALARRFAATMNDLDATNAAIERFVPYAFLKLLEKASVRQVKRGDSVKLEMSVMFCDIRGFTTLAEAAGADATFRQVNRYLQLMEPEIHKEGGYINQYMGDGIMSLFHRGPTGAVAAAVGMSRALAQLNVERATRGEEPLKIGMGIHTGDLMLGTIGGGEQLDAGVIGDAANLASRVEGMTKMYGAVCLISDRTKAALTDGALIDSLRELDTVVAKGRKEPITIFEVLACDPIPLREQKLATLAKFKTALSLYRAGDFERALAIFESLNGDAAATLFVERCRGFLESPPPEWRGVTVLTSK